MTLTELRRLREQLRTLEAPSRAVDAEIATVFDLLPDMGNESWELAEQNAPLLTYSVDQALRFSDNLLNELAVNMSRSLRNGVWHVRHYRSHRHGTHKHLPIAILIAAINVLIDRQRWQSIADRKSGSPEASG